MESVQIFRQINLKERVTAASKKRAIADLNQEINHLVALQKEFEGRRNKALTEASIKGADPNQMLKFRQQFDMEGTKYHMRRDEIIMQMEGLQQLQEGDELLISQVEGPYELKIGDVLEQVTATEVIVENGRVVEIRS